MSLRIIILFVLISLSCSKKNEDSLDEIKILVDNGNYEIAKNKLLEIHKELLSLNETFKKSIPNENIIKNHIQKLKNINSKLWDVEDGKRGFEKKKEFGEKFIKLARDVYKFNDERAKIKFEINQVLGSNIKEIKSYE